jgi:hypothetical protein
VTAELAGLRDQAASVASGVAANVTASAKHLSKEVKARSEDVREAVATGLEVGSKTAKGAADRLRRKKAKKERRAREKPEAADSSSSSSSSDSDSSSSRSSSRSSRRSRSSSSSGSSSDSRHARRKSKSKSKGKGKGGSVTVSAGATSGPGAPAAYPETGAAKSYPPAGPAPAAYPGAGPAPAAYPESGPAPAAYPGSSGRGEKLTAWCSTVESAGDKIQGAKSILEEAAALTAQECAAVFAAAGTMDLDIAVGVGGVLYAGCSERPQFKDVALRDVEAAHRDAIIKELDL